MIETGFGACLVIALAGFAVIAAVPVLIWFWLVTYNSRKEEDDDI